VRVGVLDLALIGGYLAAMTAFGLYMGRRPRDLDDYAVAGRDRPWWLVMFSIVATETSTVTFLSIPGFAFTRDLTWLQLPLGFLLGRVVVARLLLPRYFQGNLLTAYEVLRDRFGGATQRTASLAFLITRTLADGLRLFLTAIVLQEVAGISLPLAVVALGLATALYTFAGGMRAVLWADLLQFGVYVAGGLVALQQLGAGTPGGWERILDDAAGAGRLRIIDPRWTLDDPYVLAAGVIGGAFLTLGSHGVDQLMVQRYLCARGPREAGRALGVSGFVVLAQFALFLMIGVGLHAFFAAQPPAVPFDRADRIFARFIVEEMPPGLLGLLLGAVLSAAMSTLSSSLNSSATAALNDLYRPRHPDASPQRLLAASRGFTLLFAALQIGVGIAGQWLAESVVAAVLAIAGFTTGILLGVFLLGMLSDAVDERSALVGLGGGLAGMTAIQLGTTLAWPWYALVGSLLTASLGLLASRLLPRSGPAPQR
jgi:SSS family transporter